jgi:ABC-type multidrug transport system fused ATPase/permease subunit
MVQLIFMDVVISLLDIAFLATLIYVIHFYTEADHVIPFSFFPFTFFAKYPLSLIIVFFLLFAVKNGLGYLVFKLQFRFVYTVAARLSKNNLTHFLQGSYTDYVQTDSSVHIRKISQQPIQFGHYVLGGFQQITGQAILIILTVIAILIYSPFLFLLLVILLTPPVIIIGVLIKRKLNTIRKTAKPVSETSLQHLQEALAGYIESNIFQRNDFFINRYSIYQAKFNDFLSQQLVIQNLPSRFMEVFALFGLLMLIVINFYSNNSGSIQLVTIGAFMAAAYKIIPGVVKILNSIGQVKTYRYTIDELLHDKILPKEKDHTSQSTIVSIAMENISFAHKEEKLLDNFSMKISKGDLAGLSGISGKGKTTLINLLLGFLDQQSGAVLFNDKPTAATDRQYYTHNIAYVKQNTFFIHDTILANIMLAENEADKQRIEYVVKATGLDLLTAQYPEGLNKIITENGKNISGGQRQRIVIARALYKNADVIILDEPFNELDREAENKLLLHLQLLAAGGKIILLVTHNKESLAFCSKIISLDEK